jgi:hypothetical protein
MIPSIQVQASYGDPQLSVLVSIFEGNLDLDQVTVRRAEYAVKAYIPLDFVITATSTYLFEKFVLAPLIDPIAEKFNWVAAIKKYLKPVQPFRLTINLTDENLVIEAPLETSHNITAEIWSVIKTTLDMLREENRLNELSKIRFVPDKGNELLILCYASNKPKYTVNLDKRKVLEIPREAVPSPESTELSGEEWLKKQLEKSEKYRQFMARSNAE